MSYSHSRGVWTDAGAIRRRRFVKTVAASILVCVAMPAVGSADGMPEYDCLIEPFLSVNVGTPVSGVIDRILVDRSSVVRKGDVLVEFQSDLERAAVELARARASRESEVQASKASLSFNRRKHARLKTLHRQKVVPEHQIDEAATEVRLAGLQVSQAEQDKRIAELELAHALETLNLRTVKSPIDGVVVDRLKAPGEYVEDQPILSIAQLDPLRVEVVAPVSALGKIRPGMHAEIVPEVPTERELIAKVTVVDRVVDAASGTFGIRLELPNADYTVPGGLRCQVRFLERDDPRTVALTETPKPISLAVDPGLSTNSLPRDVSETLSQSRHRGPEEADNIASPGLGPVAVAGTAKSATSVSAWTQPIAIVEKESSDQPGAEVRSDTLCYSSGPFPARAPWPELRSAFAQSGVQVSMRKASEPTVAGYLVLAPPEASAAATRAKVDRMRSAGIKDLWLFRKGPNAGHTSLGIYTQMTAAKRRVAQLEALGFSAAIEPREERREVVWFDFESGLGSLSRESAERLIGGHASTAKLVTTECAGRSVVSSRKVGGAQDMASRIRVAEGLEQAH